MNPQSLKNRTYLVMRKKRARVVFVWRRTQKWTGELWNSMMQSLKMNSFSKRLKTPVTRTFWSSYSVLSLVCTMTTNFGVKILSYGQLQGMQSSSWWQWVTFMFISINKKNSRVILSCKGPIWKLPEKHSPKQVTIR